MNSSTVVSAISRPRPITTSRVAVSAISLIRCEDTNTVRPSAARPLSRFLIHSTPSGSSPLTGSSRTTTRGSPSSADAMPSRWPIPSENPPARLRATSRQADQVDHLIDPALADAVGLGQRQQVVAGRPAGVHRPGLQQDAQLGHRGLRRAVIPAVHQHPAAGGLVQPGDHPHRGGLPGPVRAEKTGHDAGLNDEIQPVDGQLSPRTAC